MEWRKKNIVSIHKRVIKSALKTTDLYCYLQFEEKFWRNLFLTSYSNFLMKKKLIATSQFGFKPGHSYINQLLSVTHSIKGIKSFNQGYKVRGLFFNISKTFNKVWKSVIIFKLNIMVLEEICWNFCLTFKTTGSRGLYWMDTFPIGQMLRQEFALDPLII